MVSHWISYNRHCVWQYLLPYVRSFTTNSFLTKHTARRPASVTDKPQLCISIPFHSTAAMPPELKSKSSRRHKKASRVGPTAYFRAPQCSYDIRIDASRLVRKTDSSAQSDDVQSIPTWKYMSEQPAYPPGEFPNVTPHSVSLSVAGLCADRKQTTNPDAMPTSAVPAKQESEVRRLANKEPSVKGEQVSKAQSATSQLGPAVKSPTSTAQLGTTAKLLPVISKRSSEKPAVPAQLPIAHDQPHMPASGRKASHIARPRNGSVDMSRSISASSGASYPTNVSLSTPRSGSVRNGQKVLSQKKVAWNPSQKSSNGVQSLNASILAAAVAVPQGSQSKSSESKDPATVARSASPKKSTSLVKVLESSSSAKLKRTSQQPTSKGSEKVAIVHVSAQIKLSAVRSKPPRRGSQISARSECDKALVTPALKELKPDGKTSLKAIGAAKKQKEAVSDAVRPASKEKSAPESEAKSKSPPTNMSISNKFESGAEKKGSTNVKNDIKTSGTKQLSANVGSIKSSKPEQEKGFLKNNNSRSKQKNSITLEKSSVKELGQEQSCSCNCGKPFGSKLRVRMFMKCDTDSHCWLRRIRVHLDY